MTSGRVALGIGQVRAYLRALGSGNDDRVRFSMVFLLAVPQIYLMPAGLVDVALSTVVAAVIAPVVLLRRMRKLLDPLVVVLCALLLVRLLAMLWSPVAWSGLQPFVLLGQFVIVLVLARDALRRDPEIVRLLRFVYWPFVIGEACLVILFRVLPVVEDSLLRTVGGFFAGNNLISDLFGTGPNNVLDPAKSGGVFPNANVAAMFLGVNGLVALALWTRTQDRRLREVGAFALVAVLFTGSKSAAVLAVVLPAVALIVVRIGTTGLPHFRRPVLVGTVGAALLVTAVAAAVRLGFLGALSDAFLGRTVIWGYGAEMFQRHPILGLGYGGWEAGFKEYAASHAVDRTTFPPHNILLASWARTGIAGLALTVTFLVMVVRLGIRRLRDPATFRVAVFSLAATAWLIIQSMGENTDLFGEIHLIPILAVMIAQLTLDPRPGKEMNPSAEAAAPGRHSAPPAVPPVGDVHRQPSIGIARVPAPLHRP